MNSILKLEELAKVVLCFYLSVQLEFSWWVYLVWFLSPDISIAAYAINTKVGAFFYNLFHHQGIAAAIGLTGLYFQNAEFQFTGLIIFGHSSFDRMLGYGLKYDDNFKHTHLGWMGPKEKL